MKTRCVSILLALLLVLGIFSVFASADTAAEPSTGNLLFENNWECFQYNGTAYRMSLGTIAENGRVITADHFVCITDETDETTLTSYLLIHDTNRNEAPREVYEALWNSCTFESYVVSDSFEDCPLLTAEDGYHRYLTTTRVGSFDGHFRVVLTDQAGEMAWLYRSISLGVPETLTPVNGQASFTVESGAPEVVYYRLDLSAFSGKKRISVSMSEGAFGRIATMDGDLLWIYYSDGDQGSYPITMSENEVILSVNVGSRPATATITVTEPVSQPVELLGSNRVLVNGTEYIMNIGHWNESSGMNLQSFSTGILKPDETVSFDSYLFLRTEDWTEASAADYEAFWKNIELDLSQQDSAVTLGTLTDSGPRKRLPFTVTGEYEGRILLTVTTPNDGNTQRISSSNVRVGLAETVSLTNGSGETTYTFTSNGYEEHFVRIDLGEGVEGAVFTASLDDQTHGSIRDADNNFLWSRWSGSTDSNTITRGYSGRYIMLSINVFDEGEITLTVSAYQDVPRLMYRQMYRQNANTPITENLSFPLLDPNNYDLAINSGWNFRLYYGRTYSHQSLNDGTLTSSDPGIVRVDVTPFGENGENYYHLHGVGCGTATLTWGDYSFDVTVGLPAYGFYTAQQRDEDHLLTSPISWTNMTETEDGYRELWFMCKDGFTAEQEQTITTNLYEANYAEMTFEPRPGTEAYDLKFLLKDYIYTDYGFGIYENNTHLGSAQIHHDDRIPALYKDDLVIGFQATHSTEEDMMINEAGKLYDGSHPIYWEDPDHYQKLFDLNLLAAVKTVSDGNNTYTLDQTATNSLTIHSLTLQPFSGESASVSLDPDKQVTRLTNLTETPTIWFMPGHGVSFLILAEVSAVVDGEVVKGTITQAVELYANESVVLQRPEDDTVEKLSKDLAAYIKEEAGSNICKVYEIHLPAITYTGTIQIPQMEHPYVVFTFHGAKTGGTILQGGIDLNGTALRKIENIDFYASESHPRAIWNGGGADVIGCSFQNYEIALDSSAGLINAKKNNIFMDNDIAAKIDIADHTGNQRTYTREWTNNFFLRNDTAVQILSLSPVSTNPSIHVTPFRFRIHESTFLGNGCDFDCTPAGSYFFSRNSYAAETDEAQTLSVAEVYHQLKSVQTPASLNRLATYRQPVIVSHENTTIVTNPRWMYCLGNTLPFANILMSDWSLPTQLLNDKPEDLVMDSSLFDTAEEKVIQLVDSETEDIYAHWTFSSKTVLLQNEIVSGNFYAGVHTEFVDEGVLQITVEDSAVLSRHQPVLTVYTDCVPAQVLLDGQLIECSWEDDQVSFPVSRGGAYIITFFNSDPDTVAVSACVTSATDSAIRVAISLENLTEHSQSCLVAAATYNKDGQMCGLAMPEDTPALDSLERKSLSLTVVPSSPVTQIRIFLLDSEHSPLGSNLSRTVPQ